ncbi:SDR family NAD(P)-dependent oxidoreductase [Peptoniphilus equinus]|uniref:SDR family NAD(P)-dependent oxidoreductase n=1 Tax=Peptoniphilus equinus TaxID=3016343 RepID=A0ABY7QTG7_9FIRM|nr:SDR family NAD(P)-dependent oxidoreductase [Peptoniphilus equinus]WBW50092.1 SDR family NAD(P)-dependent oxidoreductase [Peptoniphilus equinus]
MSPTKSVLITGGARGIGRSLALAFLARGYNTHIFYHRSEAAAKTLAAQGMHTYAVDLRDHDAICRAVAHILETGPIDVLINNAGISETTLFQHTEPITFENLFAVNVTGAFYVTQAVLPSMIERKSGAIINISSIWGARGASCEVAYAMTKGAIDAMTRSLALEVAPSGIIVNAIAPGCVETDMMDRYTDTDMAAILENIPLGRMAGPDEIASFALYLAEQTYATGQIFTLDGGMGV